MNLLQTVSQSNCHPPGTGEADLVAGEVKCLLGRIWSISGYRGVESCSGRHKNVTGQGFTGSVTEGCFLFFFGQNNP